MIPAFLSALFLLLSSVSYPPPTIPLSVEHGPTQWLAPLKGGPVPYYPWHALAECESGNDWSVDTDNGYYGGLQISLPIWFATRPDGVLQPLPSSTDPLVQVMTARTIVRRMGWQAWPVCATFVGLR